MGDEDFAFAEPLKRGPPGPIERAYRWVHARPHARVWEFLLFAIPGTIIMAVAAESMWHDWMRTPFALLLGGAGGFMVFMGVLPPVRVPPPPEVNPRSLRAKRRP